MSHLVTDLKPHLALVTGASGGIGKATCLALASMGCSIAVHYHLSIEKAEALIRELNKKGVKAEGFKADLTNYDKVYIYLHCLLEMEPSTSSYLWCHLMSFLLLTTEIIIVNFGKVRKLYAEVVEKMGCPTILFNNAGLTLKSGIKKITDVTIEEFEHTWRANCGQAFLLTQLCMPKMEKNGWGRVIFCSSIAGFNGGVVGPHYA
jgi:3-oxoacyl-[acyl-carrier protein] reductase